MAALAELNANLPSLRVNQRTPSLKQPTTPGITPGGRHYRAPEFECGALERLSEEATGFIDALSEARASRSRMAQLVEQLDCALVGMRMALRAVPTVEEGAHSEQACAQASALRQQLWAALEFLQRSVDYARVAGPGDAPPSPAFVEEQRAAGEAIATPLRARRAGATPERTPGPTPRGELRTPLPGAPGGMYGGGDGGEPFEAELRCGATPAATPLPRMASLALTPVREAEDGEGDATPAAMEVAAMAQLTPLPAAEMAAAAETPLQPTRFELSSPAAAAFARAVTLTLSLPSSPVAGEAAPPSGDDVTPNSVLQAGCLFTAASLERGASMPAATLAEEEAAPMEAVQEEAPAPATAQPQPPTKRRMHPVLRLLRGAVVLAACAAAGALAVQHARPMMMTPVATTPEPPAAAAEPEAEQAAPAEATAA